MYPLTTAIRQAKPPDVKNTVCKMSSLFAIDSRAKEAKHYSCFVVCVKTSRERYQKYKPTFHGYTLHLPCKYFSKIFIDRERTSGFKVILSSTIIRDNAEITRESEMGDKIRNPRTKSELKSPRIFYIKKWIWP